MSKADTLDPTFRAIVETVLQEVKAATGYHWTITDATRTMKRQHGLFIQPTDGIDNDGDGLIDEKDEKVTCADAGQSAHNFSEACDLAPLSPAGNIIWTAPKEVWKKMADIAIENGLVAGFYFKSIYDAPHIESSNWKAKQAAWRRGEIQIA